MALWKRAARNLAARIHSDPTAATVEDARKMAAAILLLVDGKLPAGKP